MVPPQTARSASLTKARFFFPSICRLPLRSFFYFVSHRSGPATKYDGSRPSRRNSSLEGEQLGAAGGSGWPRHGLSSLYTIRYDHY
eukprot:gene992-587_t